MPNIRNLDAKHYAIIGIAVVLALFIAISLGRLFLVVIPEQEAEETTDITSIESNKGDIGAMPSSTQPLYTVLLADDWKSGSASDTYTFSTTQMLSGDSVCTFAITHVVDKASIGLDGGDDSSKIFTISVDGASFDAAYYPETADAPARVYSAAFSGGCIVPDAKVTLSFKGFDQLASTCNIDQAELEELAAAAMKRYCPAATTASFTGDAISDLKTGRIIAHVLLNDDSESALTFLSIPGKEEPYICNGSTDDFADTGFADLESVSKIDL